MAEVQLFGDYLNLYGHSIAARGWRRAEEGIGGHGRAGGWGRGGREQRGAGDDMRGSENREEEKWTDTKRREKRTKREQDKKKRVEEKSPSQVGLEKKGQREGAGFTWTK